MWFLTGMTVHYRLDNKTENEEVPIVIIHKGSSARHLGNTAAFLKKIYFKSSGILSLMSPICSTFQSPRREEDECTAVCSLCLQNGRGSWLLQRPDCILCWDLGDHDLLPHLRDTEEKPRQEPVQLPEW